MRGAVRFIIGISIAFIAPKVFAAVTMDQVHKVTHEVQGIYASEARSKGLKLSIEIDWGNPLVAAAADRIKNELKVILYQGLIESERLSEDGLRYIICHELGHLYGGAPRKTPPQGWDGQRTQNGTTWFSAEGASDYYASAKCFRTLVESENLEDHVKAIQTFSNEFQDIYKKLSLENEMKDLKMECDQVWNDSSKSLVCQRAALGGLNMFLVVYDFDVSFHKEATEKPPYTLRDQYPSRQCRLDTALAGALCRSDFPLEFDYFDPLANTCENGKGLRPRCWFVSDLNEQIF